MVMSNKFRLQFKIHLIFLFFIVSCSQNISTQKTQYRSNRNHESIKKVNIPIWVETIPISTDLIVYGVGEGSTQSNADEEARRQIALFFKCDIKSRFYQNTESLEKNDKEIYIEYIEKRIDVKTNLQISGIQILKRYSENNKYFSLACVKIFDAKKYNLEIENQILSFIYSGNNMNNSGKKLQYYLMASSLLSKLIFPVKIDAKPEYIYLFEKISMIIEGIQSNIIIDDKKFGTKTVTVNLKSNSTPLNSIPICFDKITTKCDKNGNYYLDYTNFIKGKSNNINAYININELSYPPNLSNEELLEAKKIIHSLIGNNISIQFSIPVDYKAIIIVNCTADNELYKSDEISNQFKSTLTKNNINIVDDHSHSNLIIQINIQIYLSSFNEYFGYCYKAQGSIEIKDKKGNTDMINFSNLDIEEGTKSFNLNKDKSIQDALLKILNIMTKKINWYLENLI
jgi:hypothetical protein